MDTIADIGTPEGMQFAVTWMRRMIDVVAQDACWAVPRSGTIYRIDKQAKTFHRQLGEGDRWIEEVLKEMGWSVE